MGNSALLVVDMQKDLCSDSRRAKKVEQMLLLLNRCIDLFVSQDSAVFYTRMLLPKDDPQFERFGDKYCIEGTEGAQFIPEILPLKGPEIVKRKHSAFFETDLDDHLKQRNVNQLFLVGLQTHICIMTTAADASFRGYETVAISDCVVSSTEDNKDWALNWIRSYVGDVVALDELERIFRCG